MTRYLLLAEPNLVRPPPAVPNSLRTPFAGSPRAVGASISSLVLRGEHDFDPPPARRSRSHAAQAGSRIVTTLGRLRHAVTRRSCTRMTPSATASPRALRAVVRQ